LKGISMYAFDYEKATALAQAGATLSAEPEAKLLAGGMTLLPSMKHRLAAPSRLIDVSGLAEMRGITVSRASAGVASTLTIGAAMRHCEVADSQAVRKAIPALADLAGLIGDPQVRARGTLGGSVANSDPAADYPAAVLGLNAVLVTNRREIAADDFFLGMFTTALASDEILVALRFAVPRRGAYAKFAQMATGYAMTGVMMADYVDHVRVGVTGAGSCAFRWHEAEKALGGNLSEAALKGLKHSAAELTADIHAPAEYRAQLIKVMAAKALQDLLRR
jgi:aerobic carbon-monoxide dehydrogenase medium subunit